MSHLSPSEFVDLIDGQLEAARARHIDTCEFCRKQFEDVQESLRLSREVQMPEPSPLFWDHVSTRVRDGVSDIASDEPSGTGWLRSAPRKALAMAAVLIVVAAGWYLRPAPGPESTGLTPRQNPDETAAAADPSMSEAWETVRTAAERVNWEDAHAAGLSAPPDSVDRAILDLDDREREHLLSLLEEELERAGT